jgi:hypothetical protein
MENLHSQSPKREMAALNFDFKTAAFKLRANLLLAAWGKLL